MHLFVFNKPQAWRVNLGQSVASDFGDKQMSHQLTWDFTASFQPSFKECGGNGWQMLKHCFIAGFKV